MIYLSGHSGPGVRRVASLRHDLGLMIQPGTYGPGEIGHFTHWAADTGCYAQGESFDARHWLDWLDGLPRQGCLFATAPDVVGDATATWEWSALYLPTIRDMGFPAALVAQDGMSELPDPDAWDALFMGGTTSFKLSVEAYRLAADARRLGKWTHMGRVNSGDRMAAAGWEYDSVDGNYLAFGPDKNLPKLLAWLNQGHLGGIVG